MGAALSVWPPGIAGAGFPGGLQGHTWSTLPGCWRDCCWRVPAPLLVEDHSGRLSCSMPGPPEGESSSSSWWRRLVTFWSLPPLRRAGGRHPQAEVCSDSNRVVSLSCLLIESGVGWSGLLRNHSLSLRPWGRGWGVDFRNPGSGTEARVVGRLAKSWPVPNDLSLHLAGPPATGGLR